VRRVLGYNGNGAHFRRTTDEVAKGGYQEFAFRWPVQGQGPGLPSLQQRHDPIHARGFTLYHEPVLAMLVQGSAGGSASPACSSSMEMPSGVRMKAIRPSRGGRLIVTPRAMKALQVS